MKKCSGCGQMKDESEFYVGFRKRSKKVERQGRCKDCLVAYQREYKERKKAETGELPYCYSKEYQKKRMMQKRGRGECAACKNPALPGRYYCEVHVERDRQRRRNKSGTGICYSCDMPAEPGKSRCAVHLALLRDKAKKRNENRQCIRCGSPAVPFKHHCAVCMEKWVSQWQKARYAQAKAEGWCYQCRKPTRPGCAACTDCNKKNSEKRQAVKKETLEAYGGCRCAICGNDRIESLSLEHPDDDGAVHRRALGVRGGIAFYRRLKTLGFPQSPRMIVLCLNCNVSRISGPRGS